MRPTRELLFLWRTFSWNWPWSHGLFHNFWPQHENRLIPGSFCIIFHGEHDPHSLKPSIWPRTRQIAIFIFSTNFWSDNFFAKFWTWGYFGRQINCGGAFCEVMWPVSRNLLKTNARFPDGMRWPCALAIVPARPPIAPIEWVLSPCAASAMAEQGRIQKVLCKLTRKLAIRKCKLRNTL